MDRYLYKAKQTHGRWVRGALLLHDSDAATIFNQHPADGSLQGFEVDLSTICQCTGKKDKNGKLIFENDIAKDESGSLYKVFWHENHYQFSWICTKSNTFPVGAKWDLWRFKSDEIEIIGNIFDNPDLL